MRKHVLHAIAAIIVGLLSVACGKGPDADTGGDGFRHEAKPIELDKWITDENGVDGNGDKTDWKKFVVPANGKVYVDLRVDEKDAEVVIALYDRYGRRLIEKSKPRGANAPVQFQGEVPKGKYFIQIFARKSEDKSIYSVRASMAGGAKTPGIVAPPE